MQVPHDVAAARLDRIVEPWVLPTDTAQARIGDLRAQWPAAVAALRRSQDVAMRWLWHIPIRDAIAVLYSLNQSAPGSVTDLWVYARSVCADVAARSSDPRLVEVASLYDLRLLRLSNEVALSRIFSDDRLLAIEAALVVDTADEDHAP